MRGGLRTRLILDSVRVTLIGHLAELGWFDPTISDPVPGVRRHRPVRYVNRPASWDTDITPNCFAISTEHITDAPQSLGGDVEDTLHIYVDLFAENDAIGWQLAGDMRGILLGRFPRLGRTGPVVDVYDFRQATPAPFTQVDVDDVTVDRPEGNTRIWQRYWFMIRVDLVDDYADEFEATHPTTTWNPNVADAWARVQAGGDP